MSGGGFRPLRNERHGMAHMLGPPRSKPVGIETFRRTEQRFDLSHLCDDLESTMAELEQRGAEFEGGVTQESWGTTVQLIVPGAGTMTLYQPRYEPPALGRSELEAMW